MADSWFLGRNGKREGPLTLEQMQRMAAGGQLSPSDLVWQEGMSAWAPASSITGLFPTTASLVPGVPAAPPGLESAGYSFSAAFNLGMRTFQLNWASLVVTGLVAIGLGVAVSLPQWFLQILGSNTSDPGLAAFAALSVACIGLLVNLLLGGPFVAGFVIAGANIVAGRGRVGDYFVGFKRYGRVLAAYLLTIVIAWGAMIVCCLPIIFCFILAAVSSGGREIGPVGIVLIIIGVAASVVSLFFGIALWIRVLFAPVLVADEQLGSLGVMEALRLNWARVSLGKAFSLLGLGLVSGTIAGLSILLCCVGYILLGIPFLVAVGGSAYTQLFRHSAATT